MKLDILLLGLIAAVAVVSGGAMIAARRVLSPKIQYALLSLGAGFILALVFLKLIPASFETVGESAAIILLLGFATVHFFEHTVASHLHFGEETHADVMMSRTAGMSAIVGLAIHAFFDGFSISVGLQYDYHLGILVFVAVLLHKFPEGITVGSIMTASGHKRGTVLWSAVALGLATLIGASSSFVLEHVDKVVAGYAFAFSAGTIVYVGASDLIPEINKSESRIPPILVFAGIVLFYLSEKLLTALIG